MYDDLSNIAPDIFPILPYCVTVEASFSLGRDVIGWRQSKTTGGTLQETFVLREFAWANTGILGGDYTALDITETEHKFKLKTEVESRDCTEWPRSTTFWRCGRAAKTYVLQRRNRAHKTKKSLQYDTFRKWKRLSKHPVTFSSWWFSCIYTLRIITFATTFVCKGPPRRTNWSIKCPPNRKN